MTAGESAGKSHGPETQVDHVSKVVKALGLDSPDEIRGRQAFIGLSPEDINQVRRAKPILDKHFKAIIDTIYNNLQNFPETSKHLTSELRIEGLKAAQKDYFDSLLSGKYDPAYVQNVVRVGLAHVKIDLKPKWYIGNYCVYVCKVIEVLFEELSGKQAKGGSLWNRIGSYHGNGSHDLEKMIQSVLKTFFLDMALTLEAYIGPMMSEMTEQNELVKHRVEGLQSLSRSIGEETRKNNENVQSIASASEEMSSTIKEISENVQQSTKISSEAVKKSEEANRAMAKLDESSKEIGKVVKAIRSIAQQTNLLALNATIEAARAGEAGKGFAVVANEVKDLAKETADATEQISQRIAAIQRETSEAVSSIDGVGKIVSQVNDFCVGIAGAVEEQTATTNEISSSITETADGVANVLRKIEEAERLTK